MKKIYLLLTVFAFAKMSFAQQLHIVSQYDLHRFLHNPAGAGLNGAKNVGLTYRNQWSGISGAPVTQMISAENYFSKIRLGMGVNLYNDVTGATKRTGIQAAVNYQLPVNQEGTKKISFGMEIRGLQYQLDKVLLNQYIPGDPVLAGDDKMLKGDVGIGVYYNSKNLNIGASVSQLVQGELRFNENVLNAKDRAQFYRHYYLMGDYTWETNETKITPSVQLVYLPQSPVEFTGGVRVTHKEMFWYGLHARVKQGWMLNAGYIFKKKFSVGYALDIYRTPLSIFDRGSLAHEVMMRYSFK
jgi:type IX secretion system PorP/SprF family membrane protein